MVDLEKHQEKTTLVYEQLESLKEMNLVEESMNVSEIFKDCRSHMIMS